MGKRTRESASPFPCYNIESLLLLRLGKMQRSQGDISRKNLLRGSRRALLYSRLLNEAASHLPMAKCAPFSYHRKELKVITFLSWMLQSVVGLMLFCAISFGAELTEAAAN